VPVPTPGGGWLLEYHQEGPDPAARDAMFTNRGLMQCIADRVPVGVLREQGPARRHAAQYDVLGLALPVRWSDGRFYFESLNPKAVPVVDPVSDVLEAMARAEVDQETATQSEALDDDYDARLRIYRQIVSRQGQAGFRAALLEAYGGRCAVTGFDAAPALEGAHLRPYRGPGSNHVTNGLLLRADIHTLFDLGLLAPDPATRIIAVSKLLAGTQYAALSGYQLAEPTQPWQRPNQEALQIIWERFHEATRAQPRSEVAVPAGGCPLESTSVRPRPGGLSLTLSLGLTTIMCTARQMTASALSHNVNCWCAAR
jgi:putative restriction endonuclease